MRKPHAPAVAYHQGDRVGIFRLVSLDARYKLWTVTCPRGHAQTRLATSLSNIRSGRNQGRCDQCLKHKYTPEELGA